jgi:hypothetical protein
MWRKIISLMRKPYILKSYKQVNAQGTIGGDLVRSRRLMFTVTSISIICILCCGLVSALDSDEASVSLVWTSGIAYQGDSASFVITFKSNCSEELELTKIGLNFDWMDPNEFYTNDLSANPVSIASYGSYTFNVMTIIIPLNASVGSHSYVVGVEGTQESLSPTDFYWESPSLMIQIHDANEKVYMTLMSQVASKLSEAINATYKNAEARSLLQQAQSEYNLAISLANEEKWTEAVLSLQNANSYAEQANAAEQGNAEQKEEPQSLLFYLAIIAIIVIIAVSIIVVVVRKKRKQTTIADQSLETIEEQS